MKHIKSVLRYPGGKGRVVKQLTKHLPKTVSQYVDLMVGGGSLFFYLKSIDYCNKYWINDSYQALANFWKITKSPYSCTSLVGQLSELKERLDDKNSLKEYFNREKNFLHQGIEGARDFFFKNRCSFSGTTEMGGFSTSASEDRFTESSIGRLIEMPRVLRDVEITNWDYIEVLDSNKLDSDAIIFIDPPYLTTKGIYKEEDLDFNEFSKILSQLKVKFLLTHSDCPEIRELFGWANIKPLDIVYGMSKDKKGKELVITNYE